MDAIILTDGTTSIDLYYDTTGFELLGSGMQLGLPPHEDLFHKSDWGSGELLVRHNLGNREWPMKLAIRGTSANAIGDTLHAFNRLVGDARNFSMRERGSQVYLQFTPDGGTATKYDVITVQYNQLDFMEYFNRRTEEVIFGDGFGLRVITKPWGYGAEVTMINELGTPDMEQDSDTDSFPDNWNLAGTPSCNLDTDIYKIGTQSLKCVAGNPNEGVESDSTGHTVPSRNVVAYAWVYLATATETVTVSLRNHTDASDIDTDTLTTTDTWTKVSVSGSLPGGKDARLRITATAGATFYVDKCFLQFASTEPVAWMSSSYIYNTWTDTEGYVSHVKFDGIPGDLDAETRIRLHYDSLTMRYVYAGISAGDIANLSLVNDEATTGSEPRTFTRTSVDTNWTELTSVNETTAAALQEMNGQRFMLLAVTYDTAASTAADFRSQVASDGLTAAYNTESKDGPTVRDWRVQTHGPLEFGQLHADAADVTVNSVIHRLQAQYASGQTSVDVDFTVLMPSDNMCIADLRTNINTGSIMLCEVNEIPLALALYANGRVTRTSHHVLGSIPYLVPGVDNELYIVTSHTMGTHTSGKIKVEVTYSPRTEFFLGTPS